MATGMVLSVAQTLFAALHCQELKNLCSMFGYESQLEAMKETVKTIKAVLLDADSKHQELTTEGRDWVDKLKDAIYDADDMFDEFNTVAQRHKTMPGGKISKKVRAFFSCENQLLFAANASRKIKKLREKLDGIAKNHAQFGLSNVYVPVKRRREDSFSYVRESSIIGRDADKKAIVDLLLGDNLDSCAGNTQNNVSFVTIVGIGGVGKTALAQLVFNDHRINKEFELKMWVCVSEDFRMEGILSKMLEKEDSVHVEGLVREACQMIVGKKYMLVLDDVWNDNRDDWLKLRDILELGGRGSRVLITSRLKPVASVLENNVMIELEGLSEVDS